MADLAQGEPKPPKEWEYLVKRFPTHAEAPDAMVVKVTEELNTLGAQSWELVTTTWRSGEVVQFVFKRERLEITTLPA
jgi:hypothetical protein